VTRPRRRRPEVTAESARDVAVIAGLGLVLLAIFLWPLASTDYPVPVGPDLSVYLWWSRVGAAEGLSLVGARPGTPALIPTVASSVGVGLVPAVAGVQYALGPAIGMAGAALARDRTTRLTWATAGLLAGIWAVHLGAGFVANLAFVACFLAAAAAIGRSTTRGTIAAALLLAGGGLAHPQFLLVGAGIWLVATGWCFVAGRRATWRSDAGRALLALGGGGALVGAGMLSMLMGPRALIGDTSKDAILRRIGEWTTLRETYLERFRRNPGRYGPWVAAPAAVIGALRADRGFVGRFLLAWAAFTIVALPIGVVTGWYPPDRILTFAFCVPLLAALGLAWLRVRIGVPWLAGLATAALIIAMAWPPLASWHGQRGFLSPQELDDAVLAGRIAATTPPGTPLVFVASEIENSGLFITAHALNVARAAVPPDRVRDVRVYLGDTDRLLQDLPTERGDRRYDLASAASLEDIPRDRPFVTFVLADFAREPTAFDDPRLTRWSTGVASTVGDPRPLPSLPGEPTTSSAGGMADATVRVLMLIVLLGFGWGRWAMGSTASGLAVAPALGVAALIVVAVAAERFGLPLDDGATVISAVAGGLGYVLWFLGRGRDGAGNHIVAESQAEVESPPEIPEYAEGQHEQDRRHDPATDEQVQVEGAGEP
jgi:hypothetical protein